MAKPKPVGAAPPPDLHVLLGVYGGYGAIPGTAWEQYDHDMANWQAGVRNGARWQVEHERQAALAKKLERKAGGG
jgi:hypothetical protein